MRRDRVPWRHAPADDSGAAPETSRWKNLSPKIGMLVFIAALLASGRVPHLVGLVGGVALILLAISGFASHQFRRHVPALRTIDSMASELALAGIWLLLPLLPPWMNFPLVVLAVVVAVAVILGYLVRIWRCGIRWVALSLAACIALLCIGGSLLWLASTIDAAGLRTAALVMLLVGMSILLIVLVAIGIWMFSRAGDDNLPICRDRAGSSGQPQTPGTASR